MRRGVVDVLPLLRAYHDVVTASKRPPPSLRSKRLGRADLRHAVLRGSLLRGADLRRADLRR